MEELKQPRGCIGIVGLGLIGGSLGLELQSLGWEVHGLVHKSSTAERAKERKLAQSISTNPDLLTPCKIIILALPLSKLINPEAALVEALPPNAVVTDVGSVKEPVVEVWEKLHPRFIGSHPMAGTAEAGVESGQLGLFRNKAWVSTPTEKTDAQAIDAIHDLALMLGSKWITAQAKKHDEAVALISHLPVVVSAALLRTLGDERNPEVRNLAIALASSGFEDTTRVGGGNAELGTAMAQNNTSAILRALTSYRCSLEQLEGEIVGKNWSKLKTELESAHSLRSDIVPNKDEPQKRTKSSTVDYD